jgi:hypothetical protein
MWKLCNCNAMLMLSGGDKAWAVLFFGNPDPTAASSFRHSQHVSIHAQLSTRRIRISMTWFLMRRRAAYCSKDSTRASMRRRRLERGAWGLWKGMNPRREMERERDWS